MLKQIQKTIIVLCASIITAACNSPSNTNQNFPEGSELKTYQFETLSLLRGVNGSYNTSPKGRPARLLNVTYTISCLTGTQPSADARFAKAKELLIKTYPISPLYYANPRERSSWRRAATKLLVAHAGCQVEDLKY